jgi:CRP/FNR family transcriptional regulator
MATADTASHIASLCQSQFPQLASSTDPVVGKTLRQARFARLPRGTVIFRPGNPCSDYLLLATGCIRVETGNEHGREIVLYRVHPGQGCVLTTSCLLSHDHYPATGVVERAASALLLSQPVFEEALARSGDFRRFVFAELGGRLARVLERIESVALSPIEQRLAQVLLDLAEENGEVRRTHQQLAAELGSAREVVSRGLARFAEHGWIRPGRGHISLLDPAALAARAGR